ncbi:MAG: efflux RND transporter periplasmic adaptor subunit [Syntrophobacteraceae bacterium]
MLLARPRRSTSVLWIALAAIAAIAASGCKQKNEYAPPPPMNVTVSKPTQQAVTEYAYFTGTTEAVESVEIRARVEGYLQSIKFQPGARVKKGELLFAIDPKPFQAKLDEAKAELARREAEMKQAEATLKKKELAYKSNAVSELEVIQARADLDVAKATIQGAEAAIDTADLQLSYTRITAPISGRISRNMVDEGNLVGATERTLLATIVQDDPIHVYFNVNERDLLYYQLKHSSLPSPASRNEGTKLFMGLSNQTDYPIAGAIDYVDNRLESGTGTLQVRGVFPNPDHRLMAGLFARIQVPIGEQENALMVPEEAIGTDQRGDYILVVNDKNIVEYRQIAAGPIVNGMRVIEKGATPEDHVVVNGLQRARPGLQVNPVEGAPPKQAAAGAGPESASN